MNISNPKNIKNANFVLRYFFTREKDENKYVFDTTFDKSNAKFNKDNIAFITFKFNNIEINPLNHKDENKKNNITFNIYGFLFLE